MARDLGWCRPYGPWSAGGFDVMLLTETKIFMMAYCWIRIGYNVTCSASRLSSAGRFHSGVGLVTR